MHERNEWMLAFSTLLQAQVVAGTLQSGINNYDYNTVQQAPLKSNVYPLNSNRKGEKNKRKKKQ